MSFAQSYLGRLRAGVGSRLLLVPGCRLLLWDGKRVLLQKRSDFGIWGLIGGIAEEEEDLATATVREAGEEAGIALARADLIPFAYSDDPETNTVTFPNGDRTQFHVLCFAATNWEGRPRVNDTESLAFEWFTPDALPDMLPSSRATIAAWRAYRATGHFQYQDASFRP